MIDKERREQLRIRDPALYALMMALRSVFVNVSVRVKWKVFDTI
jgi:hypothetical protein